MKKFLDAFLPSLLVVLLVFAVSVATVAATGDVRCIVVKCKVTPGKVYWAHEELHRLPGGPVRTRPLPEPLRCLALLLFVGAMIPAELLWRLLARRRRPSCKE